MSEEFGSCTNCIHAHDAEPLCILRLCKHAIAETKECYELKAQPTIERKKGRWMLKVEPYAWRLDTWVCSECGEETTSTIMGKPRYQWCPMCGADMREGEDG